MTKDEYEESCEKQRSEGVPEWLIPAWDDLREDYTYTEEMYIKHINLISIQTRQLFGTSYITNYEIELVRNGLL